MNLKLPDLDFELPAWQEHHFVQLRKAEVKLEVMQKEAGTGSLKFKQRSRQIWRSVCEERNDRALNLINQPLDVRAFTFLMASDDVFFKSLKFDRDLLDRLLAVRSPMSRLSLTQLVRAFITHFDLCLDQHNLGILADLIKQQLAVHGAKRGGSQLATHAKYADQIFSVYGPSRLVREAQEQGIDFDFLIERFDLTGFTDSRFVQLCRFQYYLETLSNISPGEDHDVLAEVVKPTVFNSPYVANKLLGHEILERLIDRSEGNVSLSWQRTILQIAGDPRVPKSDSRYQQWWALLGDARIGKVKAWLSRFDLKLFLQVLEQSAKDKGKEDMLRMYPSRKIFMEGLLEQGLITDSRLFLSRDARSYLKSTYRKEELPEFGIVDSRDTSMIYLRIKDKAHLIEGSHSFTLKLMDKLPGRVHVADYSYRRFADNELRTNAKLAYFSQFGNDGGYKEFTHDIHLNWQHGAINFLKDKRVVFDAGKLLPPEKYRQYKEKFGSL